MITTSLRDYGLSLGRPFPAELLALGSRPFRDVCQRGQLVFVVFDDVVERFFKIRSAELNYTASVERGLPAPYEVHAD